MRFAISALNNAIRLSNRDDKPISLFPEIPSAPSSFAAAAAASTRSHVASMRSHSALYAATLWDCASLSAREAQRAVRNAEQECAQRPLVRRVEVGGALAQRIGEELEGEETHLRRHNMLLIDRRQEQTVLHSVCVRRGRGGTEAARCAHVPGTEDGRASTGKERNAEQTAHRELSSVDLTNATAASLYTAATAASTRAAWGAETDD
ncbi:hypothetical protein B0H19DRAFT_1083777 [Mycena capillaripes]|nr:hypothetical protein B0H19DRAFT_1083777 [Mycena capillaripes]